MTKPLTDVQATALKLLEQLKAGTLPAPPGYGLDPSNPASLRIGLAIGTEFRAGLSRAPRRVPRTSGG